ncbi:MAG: hypothetical protein KDA57_06930 [Planctomycetales bacterium]|nr:hypothetical protein [Planctomycetales bacterium]
MTKLTSEADGRRVPWWQPVVFASMAGGMAWGIRGQYGHETGAMIAGLLVSLTLVLLLCPKASSISLARAVAWGTLAMGIGGSMTYGSTVGLTHDAELIGHWAALRWGMLGLAIKGGLWIGFAGVFLGMGLSEVRYRTKEILLVMLLLVAMFFLGNFLLNMPFDPENRILPRFYFSDHWFWEPEGNVEPRYEWWGGVCFAWVTLMVYAGGIRGDRLACNLGLWGLLGGALGFPLGQSIQAYSAWNREMLSQTFFAKLHLNWWNVMETVFGAVMGAVLGLGAWLNRRLINPPTEDQDALISLPLEIVMLVCHLPLLFAVEFMEIAAVDAFYDIGLIMVVIPIVASLGGRWWPYWQVLPLTLLPIAGKTIRQLGNGQTGNDLIWTWVCYGVAPMLLAVVFSFLAARNSSRFQPGRAFARWTLLFTAWLYFYLNFGFFEYPWPWAEWTGRTFNGIVFTICVFGLTVLALMKRKIAAEKQTAA